jgi:hypothetical protein
MVAPVSHGPSVRLESVSENVSKGHLEGKDVEAYSSRKRCVGCCTDKAKLANCVLLIVGIVGAIFVAIGVAVGLSKNDWISAGFCIGAAVCLTPIGYIFFSLIHPRGGCCCCYQGQCC